MHIRTYTGLRVNPLDLKPDEIRIEDIAHALSMQCRFSGHTRFHYSVALHSIYVCHMTDPRYALDALLHDASEAYLVDLPRPIKHSPGMHAYRAAEAAAEWVIGIAFNLTYPCPAAVHEADGRMLRTEISQLMGGHSEDPGDVPPVFTGLSIEELTPREVESRFLYHFQVHSGR